MKKILGIVAALVMFIMSSSCNRVPPLEYIHFVDGDSLTILEGDTKQLKIDVFPVEHKLTDLAYVKESEEPLNCLSLHQNGVISGRFQGTAVVKIFSKSNPNIYDTIVVIILKREQMASDIKEIRQIFVSLGVNYKAEFAGTTNSTLLVSNTGFLRVETDTGYGRSGSYYYYGEYVNNSFIPTQKELDYRLSYVDYTNFMTISKTVAGSSITIDAETGKYKINHIDFFKLIYRLSIIAFPDVVEKDALDENFKDPYYIPYDKVVISTFEDERITLICYKNDSQVEVTFSNQNVVSINETNKLYERYPDDAAGIFINFTQNGVDMSIRNLETGFIELMVGEECYTKVVVEPSTAYPIVNFRVDASSTVLVDKVTGKVTGYRISPQGSDNRFFVYAYQGDLERSSGIYTIDQGLTAVLHHFLAYLPTHYILVKNGVDSTYVTEEGISYIGYENQMINYVVSGSLNEVYRCSYSPFVVNTSVSVMNKTQYQRLLKPFSYITDMDASSLELIEQNKRYEIRTTIPNYYNLTAMLLMLINDTNSYSGIKITLTLTMPYVEYITITHSGGTICQASFDSKRSFTLSDAIDFNSNN